MASIASVGGVDVDPSLAATQPQQLPPVADSWPIDATQPIAAANGGTAHHMLAAAGQSQVYSLPPGSTHVRAKPRKNVLASYGGQHVDGERRRNIEQMHATRGNVTTVPFRAHGAKNPNFKRQFSVVHSNDVADPMGVNRAVVDKDGCPSTTHRGVTALRHKFPPHGSSGSVLANANRSMSDAPDVSWSANPYWAPNTVDEHNRFALPPHEMRARDLAGNLRLGHPTVGGLFDPLVRRHAPDGSAIPTTSQRAMTAHVTSARVPHHRAFTHSAPLKLPGSDRSYLSGHPHYEHAHTAYQNPERVVGATTHGIKFGHRPDCNHNHAPWRRPKEQSLTNTEAVRATISMECVQSPDQMSFHQTGALRSAVRTGQFASTLPPSDIGSYSGPITTATPLPVPH